MNHLFQIIIQLLGRVIHLFRGIILFCFGKNLFCFENILSRFEINLFCFGNIVFCFGKNLSRFGNIPFCFGNILSRFGNIHLFPSKNVFLGGINHNCLKIFSPFTRPLSMNFLYPGYISQRSDKMNLLTFKTL